MLIASLYPMVFRSDSFHGRERENDLDAGDPPVEWLESCFLMFYIHCSQMLETAYTSGPLDEIHLQRFMAELVGLFGYLWISSTSICLSKSRKRNRSEEKGGERKRTKGKDATERKEHRKLGQTHQAPAGERCSTRQTEQLTSRLFRLNDLGPSEWI